MEEIIVTSFYQFSDISEVREEMQKKLAAIEEIKGLIHLTPEGINGMASGTAEKLDELRAALASYPHFDEIDYKDSVCAEHPFPRWKVELKEQTIFYKEGYVPNGENHSHISPEKWHELLTGEEPVTVLDTRNYYETRVGKFRQAIDPDIKVFTEFSDYLDNCDLPKDQTTLIYCTGGIRCEKAILEMEEKGFQKVYQLEGGILRYLEKYPNQEFDGECFVFDSRVAVDQELAPSQKYWLCPHCGEPGDLKMDCARCGEEALICKSCAEEKPVCSKNCAYHYKLQKK